MKNFFGDMNGLYNNDVYYLDTDAPYIRNRYWDVLDEAGLVGDDLCQGKDEYKSGGIFYALFLAPKIKYCLTIDESGIIQEQRTFKGFNYSKRLLKRKQNFEMINGKKISSVDLMSWKKKSVWELLVETKQDFVIIAKKMKFVINVIIEIKSKWRFWSKPKWIEKTATKSLWSHVTLL